LLSDKRLAITARIFDTGISIPVGTPMLVTTGIGCIPASSKSLDVMEPYNPVPFRPYK